MSFFSHIPHEEHSRQAVTRRVAHVRAVHPYAPAIAPTAIDAVSSRRAVSAAARVHAAVPTLPTIGA